MTLRDLVNWLHFGKSKIQNEQLVAMLQLKSSIGTRIRSGGESKFFDSCLPSLEHAIRETYRNHFETKREINKWGGVTYTFSRNGLSIVYDVSPVWPFYDTNDSAIYRGLYLGVLIIKQEKIDLEKAGQLFNKLMSAFLLHYDYVNRQQFKVFHSRGKGDIEEGDTLLKQMGVSPSIGCTYIVYNFIMRLDYVQPGVGIIRRAT